MKTLKGIAFGVLVSAALLLAAPLQAAPRALLIGVGDIPGHELPAIDLDIDNMKKVAAVLGFAPDDIKVLFGSQATYANVKAALSSWVRDGVGPTTGCSSTSAVMARDCRI